MLFLESLRRRAKKNRKRIVFSESLEPRVLKAAQTLLDEKLVIPILIGNRKEIFANAEALGIVIDNVEVVDPNEDNRISFWAEEYAVKFKHKKITSEDALRILKDPLYFAAAYVREKKAHATVAGSVYSTSEVLRAAIQLIGLAKEASIVSSTFEMVAPDTGKVLTFADCAVVPNPNPGQLAEIAVTSAKTHERLTAETACVAMLSFSTKASATHEMTKKIRNATEIARSMNPNLKIDGELQVDSALIEEIGKRKAPESSVAGRANVLIFPDLNAGNIAYKLVERLASYQAIGPLLQGLARPANDLSRGCSVDDIVNVACISSITSIDD